MLKLQRIYAGESGPWNQTNGARQMTIIIATQDDADLSRSYLVLQTELAVAAHPTDPCIRQPSFGYVNAANAQALPVAYSANSMLRDVRLDTERQGVLEATAFNNFKAGALRPYTVSVSENRVRNCFGEGWSPLMADTGNFGSAYNNGNYQSAWVLPVREGANNSAYTPFVNMCVPLNELLGLGKLSRVPMSALGQTALSCTIEEQALLTAIFARSAGQGYVAYNYTRLGDYQVSVDASVRNADGECPFWTGMGLTTTPAIGVAQQMNVTDITINANTGLVTLDLVNASGPATPLPAGNGSLLERTVDPAEIVTWDITQASLVLATMPAMPHKPIQALYTSWVTLPFNPNATTLISNSFSLPPGTVAAFWVNAINGLVTSSMGTMVRARFALNNKDLTNRSMQTFPASAVYHDTLASALAVCDAPLRSLDTDIYTVLPACTFPASAPSDQLQLTVDLTGNHPGGRCMLICLVERIAIF